MVSELKSDVIVNYFQIKWKIKLCFGFPSRKDITKVMMDDIAFPHVWRTDGILRSFILYANKAVSTVPSGASHVAAIVSLTIVCNVFITTKLNV